MTLISAFSALNQDLGSLGELLSGLRTIIADNPEDLKYPEQLWTAVDDLLGWQTQALAQGKEAWRAAADRGDLDSARRTLAKCQEALHRLEIQFSSDLFSYERFEELHRIGEERGREWREWADVVGDTLGRCQQRLIEANQALNLCWQEVAERAGSTSVSVQATNIGQQITTTEGWDSK